MIRFSPYAPFVSRWMCSVCALRARAFGSMWMSFWRVSASTMFHTWWPTISGPKGLPPTNTAFRAINQGLNLLWVHVLLPIRLALGNYDVLFSPEYLTPIWAPVARVVTYHDSTFLRRPQDYNRVWHLMYRLITIPATRRAEAIVMPSHFTATEALQLAHFDPGRIYVTPMGLPESGTLRVDTLRVDTRADQIVSRFGVASGAYLLHVGVLEHRKNLEILVRGFALWRQQGGPQQFKLVLASNTREFPADARRRNAEPHGASLRNWASTISSFSPAG